MDLNGNKENYMGYFRGQRYKGNFIISTLKTIKNGSKDSFLHLYHLCHTTPPSLKGKNRETNLSRERNESVGKRMGEGMRVNTKIFDKICKSKYKLL